MTSIVHITTATVVETYKSPLLTADIGKLALLGLLSLVMEWEWGHWQSIMTVDALYYQTQC